MVALNSKKKLLFFLLVTLFRCLSVKAQQNDSVKINIFGPKLDTVYFTKELKGIQLFNPVFNAPTSFYANTGNIGLATRPLIFDERTYADFNLNRNSYELFEYSNNDAKYYNVKRPYTNVFFVLGPKKQKQQFQFGDVLHTQNVSPRFNVGIKIRKVVSSGVYARQQANISNAMFFSSYRSKSDNYHVLGNFIFNKLITNENGGI
jgi:hypothetical protein